MTADHCSIQVLELQITTDHRGLIVTEVRRVICGSVRCNSDLRLSKR